MASGQSILSQPIYRYREHDSHRGLSDFHVLSLAVLLRRQRLEAEHEQLIRILRPVVHVDALVEHRLRIARIASAVRLGF